ncbi:hypothetical protein Glove_481g14 [Diversispora epigaea]|uniref:HMG box domain-containing protein n=1 Tax=Diversispora epigaea TaxID=1348612 RepID=A0A397GLX8_9GLOM|nr:hypothetical protein Glove_481g14 [Diversispora epigaea]
MNEKDLPSQIFYHSVKLLPPAEVELPISNRPINPFVLFRKLSQMSLNQFCDQNYRPRYENNSISILMGNVWNNADENFKLRFKTYTEQVPRLEKKHPNWE